MGSRFEWAAGLVLAGLLASACGGSTIASDPAVENFTAVEAEDPGEPESPEPTTGSTTAPLPSTATVAPTDAIAEPGVALANVLDTEPGPVGWNLAPGRWTTTAFPDPLTFETTVDMTIVSEASGSVVLANPAQPESRNRLIVASAGFVFTGGPGSAQVPVPQDPDGITAMLEINSTTEILATGTTDRDDRVVPWWEVMQRETTPPASIPCVLGDQCLNIVFTTGGDGVPVLIDERFRLFDVDFADFGVGVFVVGEPDGYDSLVTIAESIVSSLEVSASASPPGQRFLPFVGTRQQLIPIGQYRAHLGDFVVDLDVEEDIDDMSLQGGGGTTAMFGNSSGLVTLMGPTGYVAAEADQAGFLGGAPGVEDFLDLPLETVGEFDAWLRAGLVVTDTGQDEIVGLDATWWDITLDEDAPSVACTFPQAIGGRCITIMTSDPFGWLVADNFDIRIYFFEETGAVLYIQAFRQSTVDDLLADAAPLFDSITIVPVE